MEKLLEDILDAGAWQFLHTHPVELATDDDMRLRQICLNYLTYDTRKQVLILRPPPMPTLEIFVYR